MVDATLYTTTCEERVSVDNPSERCRRYGGAELRTVV
jgi:hypothetical protein